MTALTAPVGRLPISAPLPIPRRYTLLDAARDITPESERWLGGIAADGYVPGPASVFDHCATGTARIKDAAHDIAGPSFGAFTVYLLGTCTSASIGPSSAAFSERLALALQAVEAEAVERVFATGESTPSFGPYLTDANLEMLNTVAVDPVEGLALLEDEIGAKGGGGIIHVTPALATHWISANLIDDARGRGQMQTGLGTPVAVEAGLIGAATRTTPGEEVAYATGPVEYMRGDVVSVPTDYSQALDRSNNDVLYIAEREYVLSWVGRSSPSDDNHIQAGVLVDRNA